jgi:hypothetical protein
MDVIDFFNDRSRWISCVLVVLFAAVAPAQSRTWSRDPADLAREYAVISDNRSGGDVILIFLVGPSNFCERVKPSGSGTA